ncbi:uncharacterized protein [Panulirus ornatus]|uniref:uncharacterized protein n=1 Tax=Panulirus ornatus TaxID=150431 RepID=UPI003A885D25
MFAVLIALLPLLAAAQVEYETHYTPVYTPTTSTVLVTVTVTHTLRETTTTDVWITDHTVSECVVTDYTTVWDPIPDDWDTRVSVIRITSTPVVIVTATTGYNPVKTFVSIFTEFATTTVTVNYVQTITHIDVTHNIKTIPVVTTQELVQKITTTYTKIVTTTVTSNGHYY